MTQRNVFLIFGISFLAIRIGSEYLLIEEIVDKLFNRFIVIWVYAAFYLGQYSMKFPKE